MINKSKCEWCWSWSGWGFDSRLCGNANEWNIEEQYKPCMCVLKAATGTKRGSLKLETGNTLPFEVRQHRTEEAEQAEQGPPPVPGAPKRKSRTVIMPLVQINDDEYEDDNPAPITKLDVIPHLYGAGPEAR